MGNARAGARGDGRRAVDLDVRAAWDRHLPPGAAGAADLAAALVDGGTLVAAVTAGWRARPERPVLHTAEAGWVRAGELDRRTAGLARRLASLGVDPGDRVLVSGANTLALVVAHVGALRAGAVVVPANGAYREPEVAHVVRDARPRVALVGDPAWPAWIRAASPEVLVGRLADDGVAVELPEPVGGTVTGDRVRGSGTGAIDAARPGDPAVIGYTSGTTGRPKGAVLTHANLLAGARSVVLAWRWSEADRLVLCLPLFHMHGLGVGLHGTLLSGGSAVLLDGFSPDAVLDAAREHRGTMFFGVPTMYHRFATSPRVAELGGLRLCVAGSAALPAALHDTLQREAGVRVLERYGMTETVMLVSNPYDGERRPGSVGLPLPGVEVRLAYADGRDAPEICVRGPNVFAGYWDRPDATAEAFDADGFFRTGDLGAVDHDGYLRIVGRAKELVISGGFNVYPREVEDALAAHPAVAEVAVAGTPSDEWGEEVTAYVVVEAGADAPTLDELRAFGRAALAAYKLPRRLVLVDALPRNALGKVTKSALVAASPAAGTATALGATLPDASSGPASGPGAQEDP